VRGKVRSERGVREGKGRGGAVEKGEVRRGK
jgi:hypothetical protein